MMKEEESAECERPSPFKLEVVSTNSECRIAMHEALFVFLSGCSLFLFSYPVVHSKSNSTKQSERMKRR